MAVELRRSGTPLTAVTGRRGISCFADGWAEFGVKFGELLSDLAITCVTFYFLDLDGSKGCASHIGLGTDMISSHGHDLSVEHVM